MNRATAAAVWAGVRDVFRTQLWPLPTAAVVVAIAIGVGLPRLESGEPGLLPDELRDYLFTGGSDAARTFLSAIAGSLITVTALTFSLTVVTLQLASSQFSPRLLRTFAGDLVIQSTLGLFLGTFAYALTILRTVRSESGGRPEFVPEISVTLAYLLTIASVIVLILFLAHLAQVIRAESMLANVYQDASDNLRRELVAQTGPTPPLESFLPSGPSTILTATSSGFLVRISEDDLLELATEEDLLVAVDESPGAWLVAGTPIGSSWSLGTRDECPTEIQEALASTLITGFERTSVQDVCFGLRQLTDVATKALSPGINDPTTAVHALGHSSTLLSEFVHRDLGPRVLRDEEGQVRVVLRRPDLGDLLRLALDQPSRYGAKDPAVISRVYSLLKELAWVCAPHQRPTVAREVARLRRLVSRQDFDELDATELEAAAGEVDTALTGRWV